MNVLTLSGVRLDGVAACLPSRCVDNLAACTRLHGDAAKAQSVVKATGILTRRVAEPGVSSLDLCMQAAERLLAALPNREEITRRIGAVVFVTFTPARAMPCNACQVQRRLKLANEVMAFDVGLACSGYPYGWYLAGTLARQIGRPVLLLDGDVQTPFVASDDPATVPVLADAGTATLVSPDESAPAWRFSFLSRGENGDALTLPVGGKLSMDGFGVFKFVATEVTAFLKSFLASAQTAPALFDAFVPHQANVYMIRQLARQLGFAPDRLWVSGDTLGNSASASIPVTLAACGNRDGCSTDRRILLAGFGGGLSASAADLILPAECSLLRCEA